MGTMTRRAAAGAGSVYPWKRDGQQVGWTAMADLGVGSDGKRKRQAIYGKTQREVRDKLNGVLDKHRRGALPRSGRLTVGAWLERWLKAVDGSVRPRTFEHYDQIAHNHLIPAIGSRPLAKLMPSDVEAMLRQKLAAGLSPRTCLHLRAVLRVALRAAERDGIVNRNVAALARPVPVPQRELQVLTPDEARTLLERVRGDRLEALYVTAMGLGLRQGEALGLRWRDVDLEAGILRVAVQLQRIGGQNVVSEPKSQKSRRTLLLPEPVLEALRQHRAQQVIEQLQARVWLSPELVFTGIHGEPLEGTQVTKRFQVHLEAAGLPRLRFHDLRHSCASALLAAGVPMKMVSDILGHSTVSLTLNTYQKALPTLQQEAAEAMTRILRG
jgi:integrase